MATKIAFIFSQFPCYDETFILREMNELKKSGLDFEIYSLKSPKDKIIHEEARELAKATSYVPFFSLKLLRYDLFFLLRHPGRYLVAFFTATALNLKSPNFFLKTCALWYKAVGFAWLAEKNNITHVHGEWATYPATVAYIIAKLNNIPFSFTGHAHDIHLDTTMLEFKLRRAKFVVTCTEDNKRYLSNLATRPQSTVHSPQSKIEQKIHVNYHGVDLHRFSRPSSIVPRSSSLRILSVGSLLECKGFEYLIEACRILKEKGVDFECTIAGGGPLEQGLRTHVSSHKLDDKIKFTGYITQEKLIPIYQESDVFVLAMVPDKHWGIPNVLIEAMAAGAPVVCTMLPSMPELIEDGKTGFMIPAKDPAALAVIVEKLDRDKKLRGDIASAARNVVEEKFDVVKNTRRLKQIFA